MKRWDGAHCSRGYKSKNKTAIWRHFWRLNENVIKTRKTEKSCPINLSGKCVDMVADCSIVLFSTLRRQVFSSFLRQDRGANRLYKVELNTKILLSLTNFYKIRDMFLTLYYCKNEILFIHVNDTSTAITPSLVPRTFFLENGRGGKPWGRGWILTPCRKFFFPHL